MALTARQGRFAILDQFRAEGVRYMFGNPGTVEQGFLDALSEYPDITYVKTLQESIAVGIADGYARATGRLALVQLHSGVGLGNGIGMLYQAMRGHAPLLVINGDAGLRYDAMDAQMAADLVGMAAPVTKWATRVTHPDSLLRVLRRAIKTALTPPMGPVFVSLPMDVLDAPNDEPVVPASVPSTRVRPDPDDLAQAARMLAAASRPMCIVGDGIAASGAQAELARVAELAGAEVWGADSSEVNMPAEHPQFRGLLGHMFGEHSREITVRADVVLICGTYVFPEVFPELSAVFARDAKVIHIDLNGYEIAKNFPVDLGMVSDPRSTLSALADELESRMTPAQRSAATERAAEFGQMAESERTAQLDADRALQKTIPMHAVPFMRALGEALPDDAIIFDEALTSSPELTRYIPPNTPGSFFQTRGGSLGVGLPGAIGIKLAHPDRTVVGVAGDGGSMYTIQALWTAAHHGIGAKFVICNNRSYQLLKLNVMQYWSERDIPDHEFPASFDLGDPELRFDAMARSLGVNAVRVETHDQIEPAIRAALAEDGPFLIDLVLSQEIPHHKIGVKAGQ
jgi:benzoylformate decarboxylase